MSCLAIQIGFGNMLGYNFFSTLEKLTSENRDTKNYEFIDKSESRFFSYNEKEDKKCAHAILLTTDFYSSGIIQHITKPENAWYYDASCCKLLHTPEEWGWALGYNVHGPLFKDFILDAVRKKIECYDQFSGFLLFENLECDPDCGVGSYVTELLRDEFPSTSLANIIKWPHSFGGRIYNASLHLSTLQNFSDAIFVIEYDHVLLEMCQKMGLESSEDLNFVASHQLANLLLPVDNCNSIYPTLNDMLSILVPHPQFKFINLRSVPIEPLSSLPYSSHNWPTLLRNLRRMLLYSNVAHEEVCGQNYTQSPTTSLPVTLTNLLILRGKGCESADISYLHKPQLPYASWVPKTSRINVWTHPSPFLSCDRTALLANNGQLCLNYLDKMSCYTWECFSRRYFFEFFEKHGLSKEDLYLSYLNVQQIVSSYKSLKV